MADHEFNFEAEFSLLDIGATSSLLRAGTVRPTVLAFSPTSGVESVALQWDEKTGVDRALEEARRYVRDLNPAAYAVIAHMHRGNGRLIYHQPGDEAVPGVNEFLALALHAHDGAGRTVSYPVRRADGRMSLGAPVVAEAESADWLPLGDLWANPFCVGDVVRFRARERAVDPASPLWQAIVELTRLRIHDDQPNADEYMAFLDDLRNGVFVVAGRSERDTALVQLRPRTTYNPLGTLTVDAARLTLGDSEPAEVEKVGAS